MEQHRLPPAVGTAPARPLCPQCGATGAGETCDACFGPLRLHGRYRLIEAVGRGATGTVFRAWDGDRHVAIKELPPLRNEGTKARELLAREARVLQALDHPLVPRCHDHFIAGQGRSRAFYLVQDFVDGENLAQELARSGPLSEEAVLQVMAEVLPILSALHGRSPPVVHRDLKPANLMRRRSDGRLVLLDFGAVRDVLRDSKLGGSTVSGTFGFMAPEQFQGDAGPATDLYGLGALAVNLLTAKDPARLHDWDGRFRWEGSVQPSGGLAALLRSLLAPDPARRLGSATDALARVKALQRGQVRWRDRLGGPLIPKTLTAALLGLALTVGAGILAMSTSPGPTVIVPTAPAVVSVVRPPSTPVPPATPTIAAISGGTWSLTDQPRVLLGPETVALEFPLESAGDLSANGYQYYSAGVGGVRFSLRLSSRGRLQDLEDRVADASLRVSSSSDSLDPFETFSLEGAASVVDGLVRLQVHDPVLAGRIAASGTLEPRFSWSDAHGKRVSAHGEVAWATTLSERPVVGEPMLPRWPTATELGGEQRCQAELIAAASGQVTAVRVTACPAPFAAEAAKALREWRLVPLEGGSDAFVRTTLQFRTDGGLAELVDP